LIAVSGEVHELISSLSLTGRNHVCANEPLIYLCEVHVGAQEYLKWKVDSSESHRMILHTHQPVGTLEPNSNLSIIAILTVNEELNNMGALNQIRRRLRSSLLIDTPQIIGEHTFSCSSGSNDVDSMRKKTVPHCRLTY
jgi:hypothetical protein